MLVHEVVAALVYLLPIALGVVALTVARKSLTEIALWVPVLVTADLLAIGVLSVVASLGTAALLVRVLEIVALGIAGARFRKRTWSGVVLLRRHGAAFAISIGAAVVAVAPYVETSHTLNIWDRNWHAPLVASIEGQTFPFANVYEAGSRLHYHFSGDLLAACFRAFSFDALSSASALSLAHDVFMGISAGWLALFLVSIGTHRVVAWFAGVALALHGCIPRNFDGDHDGYAFHLFTKLSYRPHVPCALFALTVLAALVTHLALATREEVRVVSGVKPLALGAATFLAGMSDESSTVVFLCGMGATFLLAPRIFGSTRTRGLLLLAFAGVVFLVVTMLVTGSLASHGVVNKSVWHAPRLACVLRPDELKLSEPSNVRMLLVVCVPPITFLLATTLGAARIARSADGARTRAFGAALFGGVVLSVCLFLGTCLTVNGVANESQRFFVAPFVANLVVAAVFLGHVRGPSRALTLVALALPAAYTLYFLRVQLREETASRMGENVPTWRDDLYRIDCHRDVGARFGERPSAYYLDEEAFMTFASCRPTYLPGARAVQWPLKVYPLVVSKDQLGDPAVRDSHVAICRADGRNDGFCTHLRSVRACAAEGERFLRCSFSVADLPRSL